MTGENIQLYYYVKRLVRHCDSWCVAKSLEESMITFTKGNDYIYRVAAFRKNSGQ